MTQPARASLEVIEVCSVAPFEEANPSSEVGSSLPLTFFDLLWLRFPPVERLFFYSFPNPSSSSSSSSSSFLHSLKHSLSITLKHFLPFAGTLTWPSHSSTPFITYLPRDTVSFTVAQSNEDFNLLSSPLCEAPLRHRFIPHLTISHHKASLLALQVTVFPNAGFCIGITTHHAAFDGKSSTMFIKSWAYICSNLHNSTLSPSLSLPLPHHLTPFFDRSVITDPSGIAEAYANSWMNHGGPNNRSLKVWESLEEVPSDAVKGLFELSSSQIQKLKQLAMSKMKVKVHVSTFSVTCAYVLACLVKAEQPKEDSVNFLFAVDCRSRLDPPTPDTYFGNCVAGIKVVAETKNLVGNDGFICALEGVLEALNRVKDGGVLSGAETWILDMLERGDYGRIFTSAGSPWFEVYSTDFGWGRPKKVDMTSIDKTGAFSLSESRDDSGGIEIGLTLSQRLMEAFTSFFVRELESFREV